MPKSKKHISKEDFRRYLENRMNENERNAFERQLQKHPFEAEATDGFRQISATELNSDLQELSKRLHSEKRKTNTRFWAAAATFLLLISAGVIWFQLKEKSPAPKMTETKTVHQEKKEAETRPEQKEKATLPVEAAEKAAEIKPVKKPEVTVKDPVSVAEETLEIQSEEMAEAKSKPVHIDEIQSDEEVLFTKTKIAPAGDSQLIIRGVNTIETAKKMAAPGKGLPAGAINLTAAPAKIVHGKVVSIGDSLPLPGVTIVQKGTANGVLSDANGNFTLKTVTPGKNTFVASFVGMENAEFYTAGDSAIVVAMEPSQVALDEVVVIGYGTKEKRALTGAVSGVEKGSTDSKAQPQGGFGEFQKYLEKETALPKNSGLARKIVKVKLHLDSDGKIVKIDNKNNADSALFETTKKIVLNGPEWTPEFRNGKNIESKVDLRIVFKK